MKRVIVLVMVLAATVTLISGTAARGAAQGMTGESSEKAVDLRLAVRDLLAGHIFWTRAAMIATRTGYAAGARVADQKARENARTIGQAFVPFYGQQAGDKLSELFTGHYAAIRQYEAAAFAGSEARRKTAVGVIGKNADELAAVLASANPNLPRATVRSLLGGHAGHHVAAIEAIAKRDAAREAGVWDQMRVHIYMIADAISGAVVKQFPDRF
jgi:hypothetical protein